MSNVLPQLDALQEALSQGDEAGTVEALRDLMQADAGLDAVLTATVPFAARGLQLKYPTPHGLIALDYVWETLEWLEPSAQRVLVESCLRYLARQPMVNWHVLTPPTSSSAADDLPDRLRQALEEMQVFNAFHYAWALAERREALERFLLRVAANEVDSLGHTFIYTVSVLRLCRRCAEPERATVLLALMEYLARHGVAETPQLLTQQEDVDSVLPEAFQRINILGHNVIYAAELARWLERFQPAYQRHLVSQLDRNVRESNVALTSDMTENMTAGAGEAEDDALERLRAAFMDSDLGAALSAVADADAESERLPALRQELIVLFARIDTHQPHHFIYPQATFMLLDRLDAETRALALAQLVNMGIQASDKHGLRPVD